MYPIGRRLAISESHRIPRKLTTTEIENIVNHPAVKSDPYLLDPKVDKAALIKALSGDHIFRKAISSPYVDNIINIMEGPEFLQFVSDDYKRDGYLISLVAVTLEPLALKFVKFNPLMNKHINMVAVRGDGNALQFIHPSLTGDMNIIDMALRSNYLAYQYIPENLKKDIGLCLVAIDQFRDTESSYRTEPIVDFIHKDLLDNNLIAYALVHADPQYFGNLHVSQRSNSYLINIAISGDPSLIKYAVYESMITDSTIEHILRYKKLKIPGKYYTEIFKGFIQDNPHMLESVLSITPSLITEIPQFIMSNSETINKLCLDNPEIVQYLPDRSMLTPSTVEKIVRHDSSMLSLITGLPMNLLVDVAAGMSDPIYIMILNTQSPFNPPSEFLCKCVTDMIIRKPQAIKNIWEYPWALKLFGDVISKDPSHFTKLPVGIKSIHSILFKSPQFVTIDDLNSIKYTFELKEDHMVFIDSLIYHHLGKSNYDLKRLTFLVIKDANEYENQSKELYTKLCKILLTANTEVLKNIHPSKVESYAYICQHAIDRSLMKGPQMESPSGLFMLIRENSLKPLDVITLLESILKQNNYYVGSAHIDHAIEVIGFMVDKHKFLEKEFAGLASRIRGSLVRSFGSFKFNPDLLFKLYLDEYLNSPNPPLPVSEFHSSIIKGKLHRLYDEVIRKRPKDIGFDLMKQIGKLLEANYSDDLFLLLASIHPPSIRNSKSLISQENVKRLYDIAISVDPMSLEYVPHDFESYVDICTSAVRLNWEVIKFIPPGTLVHNVSILKQAQKPLGAIRSMVVEGVDSFIDLSLLCQLKFNGMVARTRNGATISSDVSRCIDNSPEVFGGKLFVMAFSQHEINEGGLFYYLGVCLMVHMMDLIIDNRDLGALDIVSYERMLFENPEVVRENRYETVLRK